ncbi:hypothetical protein J4221_00175 [Candidatus Pacearchaeota archaeon]|nr:hypothetical protein [Candidatus Pacearchaeota archaeon]
MLNIIFSDTEYNYQIETFCPRCGSLDVVVEFIDGFYYFDSCNKCGYRKKESIKHIKEG